MSCLDQQCFTLEEITVGQCASFDLLIEEKDVDAFALLSGDFSSLHMDEEFARRTRFRGRCAHGMLPLTSWSALVGMCLPGAHAILLALEASFLAPVRVGDKLHVVGTVLTKSTSTHIIKLQVCITNPETGLPVTEGHLVVLVAAPPRKGVSMSELQGLDLDLNFTGKTVIVTGASRGIGEVTAKLFAHKGANVVVNYHLGKHDAEAVVSDITRHGHNAIAVEADITDRSQVKEMVRVAHVTFKSIDVLVNNAVRDATPAPFEDLTWDTIQQDIDVTVKGAFYCCQEVLPHMLRQGKGCIVNLSTLYTESPIPKLASYVMSKSGLVGLTRALAVEFAGRHIRVNLVTPNVTPTDLTNTLAEQSFKRLAGENPMKRNCEPVDIAKAILILASPYAEYTTGQQIMVTGGVPPFV